MMLPRTNTNKTRRTSHLCIRPSPIPVSRTSALPNMNPNSIMHPSRDTQTVAKNDPLVYPPNSHPTAPKRTRVLQPYPTSSIMTLPRRKKKTKQEPKNNPLACPSNQLPFPTASRHIHPPPPPVPLLSLPLSLSAEIEQAGVDTVSLKEPVPVSLSLLFGGSLVSDTVAVEVEVRGVGVGGEVGGLSPSWPAPACLFLSLFFCARFFFRLFFFSLRRR